MISVAIQSVAPQPPPGAGSPSSSDRSKSDATGDQFSFDALMAAVVFPQSASVALMSQTLARTDTPLSQTGVGRRSARLTSLRQSDAESRTGGGSRIGGADGAAVQPESSPASELTGQRNVSVATDANNGRRAEQGESSALRTGIVGSAVRTTGRDDGSSQFEARNAAQPSADRDASPSSGRASDNRDSFAQVPEQRIVPAAPSRSSESALNVRSGAGDVAANRIGKAAAIRGPGGSEARGGSQDASANASQARGKSLRIAPESGVNQTQKQGHPRPDQLAAYERVSQAIRTMKDGKDWVTRIRLDPPSLGHLRIEVRMSGGAVRVRLNAETADAQRALTSQLSELRASLEEHGLRLDRIDITSPNRGDVTSDNPTPNESSHTPEPHRDVGDGLPRREDREANENERDRMGSSTDEPAQVGEGEALVSEGWLDVHA